MRDSNALVRATAVKALVKLDLQRAVPFLIPCLKDDARGVAFWAALALGQARNSFAVPALVESLSRISWASGDALSKMGTDAVEPLIAALEAIPLNIPPTNQYPIGAMANALGRIGDPRAVEPLLSRLPMRFLQKSRLAPSWALSILTARQASRPPGVKARPSVSSRCVSGGRAAPRAEGEWIEP